MINWLQVGKDILGWLVFICLIGSWIYFIVPHKENRCALLEYYSKDRIDTVFWYGAVDVKSKTIYKISWWDSGYIPIKKPFELHSSRNGYFISEDGDSIHIYLIWKGKCGSDEEMDNYLENPPDPPEDPRY